MHFRYRDEKKKVYMQVLTTLSAREQFWLARVILKDMKMGVRHESMLKLYHPKATDIYNASSSLARGKFTRINCLGFIGYDLNSM
jgi:hypothetical protein